MKLKTKIIVASIISSGVVIAGISSFLIIASFNPSQESFDSKIQELMLEKLLNLCLK